MPISDSPSTSRAAYDLPRLKKAFEENQKAGDSALIEFFSTPASQFSYPSSSQPFLKLCPRATAVLLGGFDLCEMMMRASPIPDEHVLTAYLYYLMTNEQAVFDQDRFSFFVKHIVEHFPSAYLNDIQLGLILLHFKRLGEPAVRQKTTEVLRLCKTLGLKFFPSNGQAHSGWPAVFSCLNGKLAFLALQMMQLAKDEMSPALKTMLMEDGQSLLQAMVTRYWRKQVSAAPDDLMTFCILIKFMALDLSWPLFYLGKEGWRFALSVDEPHLPCSSWILLLQSTMQMVMDKNQLNKMSDCQPEALCRAFNIDSYEADQLDSGFKTILCTQVMLNTCLGLTHKDLSQSFTKGAIKMLLAQLGGLYSQLLVFPQLFLLLIRFFIEQMALESEMPGSPSRFKDLLDGLLSEEYISCHFSEEMFLLVADAYRRFVPFNASSSLLSAMSRQSEAFYRSCIALILRNERFKLANSVEMLHQSYGLQSVEKINFALIAYLLELYNSPQFRERPSFETWDVVIPVEVKINHKVELFNLPLSVVLAGHRVAKGLDNLISLNGGWELNQTIEKPMIVNVNPSMKNWILFFALCDLRVGGNATDEQSSRSNMVSIFDRLNEYHESVMASDWFTFFRSEMDPYKGMFISLYPSWQKGLGRESIEESYSFLREFRRAYLSEYASNLSPGGENKALDFIDGMQRLYMYSLLAGNSLLTIVKMVEEKAVISNRFFSGEMLKLWEIVIKEDPKILNFFWGLPCVGKENKIQFDIRNTEVTSVEGAELILLAVMRALINYEVSPSAYEAVFKGKQKMSLPAREEIPCIRLAELLVFCEKHARNGKDDLLPFQRLLEERLLSLNEGVWRRYEKHLASSQLFQVLAKKRIQEKGLAESELAGSSVVSAGISPESEAKRIEEECECVVLSPSLQSLHGTSGVLAVRQELSIEGVCAAIEGALALTHEIRRALSDQRRWSDANSNRLISAFSKCVTRLSQHKGEMSLQDFRFLLTQVEKHVPHEQLKRFFEDAKGRLVNMKLNEAFSHWRQRWSVKNPRSEAKLVPSHAANSTVLFKPQLPRALSPMAQASLTMAKEMMKRRS